MALVRDRIKLERHKELLANPKVQAMLRTIRYAEGTGDEGYGTRVGGEKFTDLSKKPGKKTYIKSIGDYSSAEGAYQFLNKTWEGVSKKLGLTDFSKESQDIAAVDLIIQRGALDDILNGNFKKAVNKLAPEWASLPKDGGGSNYKNQKARKFEQLEQIYYGENTPTPKPIVKAIRQEDGSIISNVSNFATPIESYTFAEEENKEVAENKNIQELQQKANEKQFLEELYSQEEPQYGITQEEAPQQQKPTTDFLNVYNQVSQFIDQPIIAQQGGKYTDILKEDLRALNNKTGIQFTMEGANSLFGRPVEQPIVPLLPTPQKRTVEDLQTSKIVDITSGTNRYTPDGGIIIGDYKKVWMNQKPEYYTGKEQPKEGQDFIYMNPNQFSAFQASEGYKNYKAGNTPQQVTMKQQGGEKNSLWKNIRANRGSGKKPTKEMLEQEKKIKAKKQEGGIIEDNQGQYKFPGEITKINAPNITMKNIPYNIFAVADTGETKMMKPNQDYYFKGAKSVIEYPQLTEQEKAFLKELKNSN